MPALSELKVGTRAVVVNLSGEPGLVQRLSEFGLFEGEEIELVGFAPLGDPLEIRLGNTRLSLRKAEAATVAVKIVPIIND